MSEFNEPWRVGDSCACTAIKNAQGIDVIYGGGRWKNDGADIDLPDAERIVACVNFCRNLPTDLLEAYVLLPREDNEYRIYMTHRRNIGE